MNSRNLQKQIEEFENTPEGYSHNLRLDLSEIVLRYLNASTMTQAKLAHNSKTSPQMVTRIVHAASNCTLQTAANLLFALGVKVKLEEIAPNRVLIEGNTGRYITRIVSGSVSSIETAEVTTGGT